MENKNEIMIADERSLRDKIYVIRGHQVMLDYDLAEIYGDSVSAFNQQVNRNIERFPDDFLFELTSEEMLELSKSQNVISIQTAGVKGGRSKPVKAFTESGIYMPMTVLKGSLAIEQSKTLIRLFKNMKDYIIENQQLMITHKDYMVLAEKVDRNSAEIESIKDNMITKAELPDFMKLFDAGIEHDEILILDGEPFKADLAYQKIYRRAKRKLIVVDDYIDTKTLQHLLHSKSVVKLTIISDNKAHPPLRNVEYTDFQNENPGRNIAFITTAKKIHDRYIVLDYNTKDMRVYHCGASSKDAGKRITTITQINDVTGYRDMVEDLLANPPLVLK